MKQQITTFTVLLTILFSSCGSEEKNLPVERDTLVLSKVETAEPMIVPAFNQLIPKSEVHEISNDSITIALNNNNGTSLVIPPDAFVDSNGNKVEGSIVIHFREMRTLTEQLSAGIPMNYLASNLLKRFNTATQFEIRFEQNGNEIYPDSGKAIQLRLALYGDHFDLKEFYLDELKERNWNYIRDLSIEGNPERKKAMRRALSRVKELKVPLSGDYFAFNYLALLDVYLNDKTVDIKKKKQDPAIQSKIKEYGVSWTNMYCFQPIDFEGKKVLSSSLIWKKVTGDAWPVWANNAVCNITPGNDGNFNLELTKKGLMPYKAVIRPYMPVKSLLAFSPAYWKNKYKVALNKAIKEEMQKQTIADGYTMLEINRSGYYCCSRLQADEDYIQVHLKPEVNEKEFEDLSGAHLYYVSATFNTVIRYPYTEWKNITVLPDRGAIMIIVNGNKAAIYNKDDWDAADLFSANKKQGIELKLRFAGIKSPINDLGDLSKILGLD